MSQWFQRMTGSGRHGEVSDATIQGYLRSASQLEDIWQKLDDKVDGLILEGVAPWDAYAQMGYALAFVRACRMITVCVQELLKAHAMANPAMPGSLPRVTYDQALALCEHIEPFIEEAVRATTSPHYIPSLPSFPLPFGPFVGDQHYPASHLQGFLGAAQQIRDWTAGLLAKYDLALHAPKLALPQEVAKHLEAMNSALELGDFHLRSGVDMAGQISKGPVPDELSMKAIGFLWEAMDSFFRLSQVIAFPVLPGPKSARTQQHIVGARSIRTPLPPGHPQGDLHHPRDAAVPTMDGGTTHSISIPVPTEPSGPDVNELLNEVITTPGATRAMPTPPPSPSPDVSSMFDQVIANVETRKEDSPTDSQNGDDLLNQVIASPKRGQNVPPSAPANASDLLDQVIASPKDGTDAKTQKSQGAVRKIEEPQKRATPEDDILRMLADLAGEQQNNDTGKD